MPLKTIAVVKRLSIGCIENRYSLYSQRIHRPELRDNVFVSLFDTALILNLILRRVLEPLCI